MPKILVVDDEPLIASLNSTVLGGGEYEVLSTSDPAEALDLWRMHAREIHLLVTDYLMPGKNGLELLAEMRRDRPELPVLLVTGSVIPTVLPPNTLLLSKPFVSEALLQYAQKLIGPIHSLAAAH